MAATLSHTRTHSLTPLLELNEKGLQEQRDKKEWRPSSVGVSARGGVGVGCVSFIKTFNTQGLLIDFVRFGQTFIFGSYRQA